MADSHKRGHVRVSLGDEDAFMEPAGIPWGSCEDTFGDPVGIRLGILYPVLIGLRVGLTMSYLLC